MVKLDTANAVTVGTQDIEYTLPEIPGFKLTVKAGSVTFPDGSKTGQISVTPVNANKVPMPPPNAMQPQFIVTIQPAGAMFDPPAPLTLPNVDGHPPGAQVELYSYDHDLEEFVTIGLGTVTHDGSVIESNPGVGVVKAGWHCGSQPGGSGCCQSCGVCEDKEATADVRMCRIVHPAIRHWMRMTVRLYSVRVHHLTVVAVLTNQTVSVFRRSVPPVILVIASGWLTTSAVVCLITVNTY